MSIITSMADGAAIEPDRGVKSEVGNKKSEIGSWKSEVGRPSSAFVVLTSILFFTVKAGQAYLPR